MQVKNLINELGYKVLVQGEDVNVSEGYSSDLLSDVMANCPEGGVWLTVQRHMNVIAVAQLKRIAVIVLVNGLEPDATVLERAGDEGITILSTPDNAFTASGRIFSLLNSAG